MDSSILDAFKVKKGLLQDCRTLKTILDENEVSWEEFVSWLDKELTQPTKPTYIHNCPKCKRPMTPHEVNSNRSNRVGGIYRSMWFCLTCGHDEYSILTLSGLIEKEIGMKGDIHGGL